MFLIWFTYPRWCHSWHVWLIPVLPKDTLTIDYDHDDIVIPYSPNLNRVLVFQSDLNKIQI